MINSQKSYRFIDLIFGTHNIFQPRGAVYRRMFDRRAHGRRHLGRHFRSDRRSTCRQSANIRSSPAVNIMFGCNNFCTYCIVPYVRGRESAAGTPEGNSAGDRTWLADDGVVEVMLLGQNVNSYGKDAGQMPLSFAQLLQRRRADRGAASRVRFMTSHPKDLSDELIAGDGKVPGQDLPTSASVRCKSGLYEVS